MKRLVILLSLMIGALTGFVFAQGGYLIADMDTDAPNAYDWLNAWGSGGRFIARSLTNDTPDGSENAMQIDVDYAAATWGSAWGHFSGTHVGPAGVDSIDASGYKYFSCYLKSTIDGAKLNIWFEHFPGPDKGYVNQVTIEGITTEWAYYEVDLSTAVPVRDGLHDMTAVNRMSFGGPVDLGAPYSIMMDQLRLINTPGEGKLPEESPQGLIAQYTFDEGSGDVTADVSGNGNDATLMGGPVWTEGVDGTALELDGVDDYVECGNNSILDVTDQLTVAAWVNQNDAGNGEHNPWITKGDHVFGLKHQQDNNFEFFVYTDTWHVVRVPSDTSYNGEWHHFAGTYDGQKLNMYIDGVLRASTPLTGAINVTTDSVNIGRNSEATDRFYNGKIDDVRLYNVALTREEIAALAGVESYQASNVISRASQPPVIDGVLDAIWKNAGMDVDFQYLKQANDRRDWYDCALGWRGLYDDDNLYLFLTIIDDTMRTDNEDAKWKDDSFEIWLDGNNSKLGENMHDDNDVHMLFPYDPAEIFGAPVVGLYNDQWDPANVNMAVVKTEYGADVEISIPLADLGMSPFPGYQFGMEIEYNDDDTGQHDHKLKQFNSGTTLWKDPSQMGTVELGDRTAYYFLDVRKTMTAPVIDGEEDESWLDFPLISANQWVQGPENQDKGWKDNWFDFRASWDEDYLYLIVYAKHDTLIENRPESQAAQYWNDTALEVWLDTDYSRAFESKDDNDVNLGFTWDPVTVVDSLISGNISDSAKATMLRGGMVTEDGVNFELAIPLGAVESPVTMEHGSVFGFDIGNLDDDGATASKATYWATASTIWKDPSLWGTAVLLDHDVAADEIETGVEEQITEQPSGFELSQNYPNPFNPTTTIDYSIERSSHVELAVFNTLGQRVATLVDAKVEAGLHSVKFDASKLSSGVYFYRLKTNNNIITKKLMLLR